MVYRKLTDDDRLKAHAALAMCRSGEVTLTEASWLGGVALRTVMRQLTSAQRGMMGIKRSQRLRTAHEKRVRALRKARDKKFGGALAEA